MPADLGLVVTTQFGDADSTSQSIGSELVFDDTVIAGFGHVCRRLL